MKSTGFLAHLWRQKWLIVATAALTLAITAVWSQYFLPVRYMAETTVIAVQPRVLVFDDNETQSIDLLLKTVSEEALSRTRLEAIIEKLNLYERERTSQHMEDVIEQMRRQDINITIVRDDSALSGVGRIHLSYASADPRSAMRVADQLTASLVQETSRYREMGAMMKLQFVEAQIEELRVKVAASQQKVESQRRKGGSVAQADVIEYQVRQDALRDLFLKQHELTVTANAVRRQVGEQFKIIEAAKLPTQPITPDRTSVNTAGGVAGLMIGLIIATVGSFRRARSGARAVTSEPTK
jgi:uncharacterized protein involved in exopolysaccharide biosynthesis